MASFGVDQVQVGSASNDATPTVYGISFMLMAINSTAVGLRFLSRRISRTAFGLDDHLAALALFFTCYFFGTIIAMGSYGLGKHAVDITDWKSFWTAVFASEIGYALLNFSVKGSILVLYLRQFGWDSTSFMISWGTNLFVAFGILVGLLIVTFTQCHPINSMWDSAGQDSCHILSDPWTVVNSFNAISTLGILVLPTGHLWRSQLPPSQVVGVGLIFAFGWIALVLGIVRIPIISIEMNESDPSFVLVPGVLMSFAEVATGMVCACLPTMLPLFSHLQGLRASAHRTDTRILPSRTGFSRAESRGRRVENDLEKSWTLDSDSDRKPIAASRGSPLSGSPLPSPMIEQLDGVRVDRKVELTFQSADVDFKLEPPPIPDISPWDVPLPDTPKSPKTPTSPGTPKRSLSLARSNSTVTTRSKSKSRAPSRATSRARSKPRPRASS